MRLLELFCGTKSVSNAVGDRFDEIVSVDILSKFNPTVCCDILQWDYTQYPTGYFDVIWASPPCIEYSVLKHNTKMETNIELADRYVKRTLEIIDYFKPTAWFIENPQTGKLKSRPFMASLPRLTTDYCAYSDWGYRKRTNIWTNQQVSPKLCKGEGKCPNMVGKYHKVSFGGQGRPKPHTYEKISAGENVYRIPPLLIQDLFSTISNPT